MTREPKNCKCKNCNHIFIPDCRNVGRQKYCRKPECRKASKAESQRRWLSKPDNVDYFRGPENVERVQQWRRNNPGYWRKKSPEAVDALQDPLGENFDSNQTVAPSALSAENALQEPLPTQDFVLLGLIAHLTGCALQDDIDHVVRRLRDFGRDIFNFSHPKKGENHEQTPCLSGTGPPGPQAVQLGGPSAGP